jgi:WD40 repeat protein
LGIKSVCWSPDSQFLAVGGYDHKVFFFWDQLLKKKKKSTGL